MHYFKYNQVDFVAYKRDISRKEFVVDVFVMCDMSPTIDKNIQRFAENLFLEPQEPTDLI